MIKILILLIVLILFILLQKNIETFSTKSDKDFDMLSDSYSLLPQVESLETNVDQFVNKINKVAQPINDLYVQAKISEKKLRALSSIGSSIGSSIKSSANEYIWIVDSGTSRHMTPNKNIFKNYQPVNGKVTIPNNNTLDSIGVGTVLLQIRNKEGSLVSIELQKVWHVPSMNKPLFSVKEWNKQYGNSVIFGKTNTLSTLSKEKQPILLPIRILDNEYVLDTYLSK